MWVGVEERERIYRRGGLRSHTTDGEGGRWRAVVSSSRTATDTEQTHKLWWQERGGDNQPSGFAREQGVGRIPD